MIVDVGFEAVDGVFFGALRMGGVVFERTDDVFLTAEEARDAARLLALACGWRTTTRLVTTLDAKVVEVCNDCGDPCDAPPHDCGIDYVEHEPGELPFPVYHAFPVGGRP